MGTTFSRNSIYLPVSNLTEDAFCVKINSDHASRLNFLTGVYVFNNHLNFMLLHVILRPKLYQESVFLFLHGLIDCVVAAGPCLHK
jgi:hypothetical protein